MSSLLAPAPNDPVATPPARRPGSVRRTSTMLMSWPGGLGTELHLNGRARDLLTPVAGEPLVLAATTLDAVTGQTHDIQRIEAEPGVEELQRLIGRRARGNLRKAIAEELPQEVEAGTPLYLLLDDLAGAALISGFAFFVWADEIPGFHERMAAAPPVMIGVCSGFQEGSSALNPDGTLKSVSKNTGRPGPLVDPADPVGSHELPDHPEIAMRRARRIDVWEESGEIRIDAMSATAVGIRRARKRSCTSTRSRHGGPGNRDTRLGDRRPPRAALPRMPRSGTERTWMEGTPLRAMRRQVLERLRDTNCCTHLNDGLRALAEVPVLAAMLPDNPAH